MARKKIRNFTIGFILFVVTASIVVTGFGTGGGGLGDLGGAGGSATGTELAKVGGRPITTDQANNQFNASFARLRQQLPNAQIIEFLNEGGFEGAVERLIALEALRQYADARGIAVSRQMIDNAITTAPEFQFARIGANFDNNLFQRALQGAGVTINQVREEYGRQLLQRQALNPIADGFTMPRGVAEAYATVPMERRTGVIGVVPAGAIERTLNPSDAEIAAYYREYRDFFAAPERRVFKYALIGPEQVSITAPTEAEIRDVYGNTPHYQQRETRTLESLIFRGASAQADATAFAQRVRGGTAFQQAAQAAGRGEAYSRRANQTQQQFSSLVAPEVSAQAFRAQQGAVIGPVRSSGAWYVVRVEEITRIGGRPLETVRAAIVRELERRKRVAAINALATRLETQLEDEVSLDDAARGARLTVVTTPAITAQGRLANGSPWTGLTPEVRALLPAVFDLDPDERDPQLVSVEANARYALVAVAQTEPAAAPPLAEIRDRVRAQLVRRTAVVRSYRIANAIAARINQGMPVAQAFAQAGLPLPPPEPISAPRGTIMSRQAPESLQLFFRLRPGTAGIAPVPNSGGYMVAVPQQSIRTTEAVPQSAAERTRAELAQVTVREAEWALLKAMEDRIGVTRNAAAIRAERQRIAGTMTLTPQ